MASENRVGVDVTQVAAASASTPVSPALIPAVVGVCRQIVETLDSEGALNSDAKYADARYNQASMFIPQADFPDPRSNIDELNLDEATIGAALYFGGTVRELDRGSNDTYGSAFLKLMNKSRAAALRTSVGTSFAFDATVGDAFTFALDVVNPENVSSDITVTFVGTLTVAEVVEAVNEAAGADVATVEGVVMQITSPTFGATSSITIRPGTSALPILFGATFDDDLEHRITGAGFHGQDDEDNDLITPWIEFSRGAYTTTDDAGVITTVSSFPASPTANVVWIGQVDQDDVFNTAKAAAVTYTGTSATVPLIAATASVPGDQMWAGGAQVGSGEIIKVEASRFKIGKLNNSLSTFDDDGEPTNRVYDTVEVNTENHGTPFAPKYVYFKAFGLTYGEILPEGVAATLTGGNQGLVERSAYVQSTTDITFPLSPASLTFRFAVTEDGVEGDEVTYTFAGGPYANIAALVALLDAADEFSQITVGNAGGKLVLQTTKTGSDQSITVKSTGTANTALKFSAAAATTDTGKDVEFAEQATLTGDFIALPMAAETSLTFGLTVEDSKGTHTVTSTAVTLATVTNFTTLIDQICEAFGSLNGTTDPTIYDGGIPIATLSSSGGTDTTGTLTITTVEGGSAVTLELTAVDETDGWRFLGFHDDTGGTSAQLDSAGGISDFIDLAGSWVIGATSGFRIEITTGPNAIVATDLTIAAATYDADSLATEMASVINTAIGAGTVTVVWVDAGHFLLTAAGATAIAITARGAGTDRSDDIWGGAGTPVDQDAVATTWTGDTPAQTRLTIEATFTYNAIPQVITGLATYAMAAAADAETLAELLNSSADFAGYTVGGQRLVEWVVASGTIITIRTIKGGTLASIQYAAAQPGFVALGFDGAGATDSGAALGGNADDTGDDLLKSTTLVFNLDDNPYDYSITFDSNSLAEAIDLINEAVDGSDDVATESSRALVLTSLLSGAASKVYIDAAAGDADDATVLDISGTSEGSGRPNPDFYLDAEGAVHIGPNILRNKSSGIPFSLESALADLYLPYIALRKDVTSSAETASLLAFDDTTTMEASIGPISTKNPLALGVFLAMANCQTYQVSALGIDEDSAAAPYGTLDGWSRAIEFLESKEIYALAPLTDDEYVQGLLSTHVIAMSAPTERGERILFIWQPIPSRADTITVSSGEDGETNGTDNSFTLDSNPNADLITNDIDPSETIEVDENLYLEVVVTSSGASELRRYSVEEVNGVVITLRTTFADDENVDGFFTTETLDEEFSAADYSLKIRGAELLVTGTTIPDLASRATAAASAATPYAHRRVYMLACASVDTSIDGVTQNVEGFYAAAAIAGMVAQQAPQQPFTHFPITGLGAVYGTDDTYSENQLDTVADGGRYVLINMGGAVVSRKQLSTSTTSIQNKELSITKAIDYLAKGLRATNRAFIGRSNVTSGFLDQLTLANEGYCDYIEALGVVKKAELKSLLQDTDQPDTVLVEVEVEVLYPCNKIKITIVS
jgi:hypothetical protein